MDFSDYDRTAIRSTLGPGCCPMCGRPREDCRGGEECEDSMEEDYRRGLIEDAEYEGREWRAQCSG